MSRARVCRAVVARLVAECLRWHGRGRRSQGVDVGWRWSIHMACLTELYYPNELVSG